MPPLLKEAGSFQVLERKAVMRCCLWVVALTPAVVMGELTDGIDLSHVNLVQPRLPTAANHWPTIYSTILGHGGA